jgi:hypothetical protein
MTATIRERDAAWSDYRQSPDSLSPSADRRALLRAGDAMAQMLQMQHPVEAMHGLGNEVIGAWCNGCDANERECWVVPVLAEWKAAAG